MRQWLASRLNASLERRVPERRVFIRSDEGTRFLRLSPGGQVLIAAGGAVAAVWMVLGAAVVMSEALGTARDGDAPRRDQTAFEARLDALAAARDAHALEARAADARYAAALGRLGGMQEALLEAQGRLIEADTGLEAVQATMRRVIAERDLARRELAALTGEARVESAVAALRGANDTVDLLAAALEDTAGERDAAAGALAEGEARIAALEREAEVVAARNERIFERLEEVVSASIEPLERMFSAAGLPMQDVLAAVRGDLDGQGGPLEALVAVPRDPAAAADMARANALLGALGEVALYRAAADTLPFADPVPSKAYRLSSGFGPRRDPFGRGTRMHSGLDFAGARGTPIHATADGVVTRVGWMRGYGKTIDITHAHGLMTRYAHLDTFGVEQGQRVSRGDRIGGMGTTGRSTGVHLHYEVRVNGSPTDPMTYIEAARDVL